MARVQIDLSMDYASSIRRRVRLVIILDAAERAGLAPLPIMRLHTIAYLANVLAPVWDMPAIDGKILKRQGGPFYPALQQDLDRLVGQGVVAVSNLTHVDTGKGRWRLEGTYKLVGEMAQPILVFLEELADERRAAQFVRELVLALSALSDQEIDAVGREDATYADPRVGLGNVVDFGEWSKQNSSANAAERFASILPTQSHVSASEKVHLYVRHLQRRMANGG